MSKSFKVAPLLFNYWCAGLEASLKLQNTMTFLLFDWLRNSEAEYELLSSNQEWNSQVSYSSHWDISECFEFQESLCQDKIIYSFSSWFFNLCDSLTDITTHTLSNSCAMRWKRYIEALFLLVLFSFDLIPMHSKCTKLQDLI